MTEPVQTSPLRDLTERAVWTLAQVIAGLGTVELTGLPEWLAVPIAVAISVVKTAVKAKFGKPAE